ncbi:MAG: RnfABCDGE type electron transport complex subunit D [Deltaproteobacteria bacterium]|nr:RnfABCDGE type electron transport complex subunit D [Deltaproteobacteria bacterium]
MADKNPTTAANERLLAPLLSVASSPHIRTRETIPRIMWTVNATLIPVAVWAVYIFGWRALLQIVVSGLAAVITELVIQKQRGVARTWHDGSAFLTGLLLAFCIPVGLPLWMTALGSVFSVAVAKHAFGGLGQNIFNPAHAGRAFLLASFPVQMTTWTKMASLAPSAVDGVTTATPLGILKEATKLGHDGMSEVIATFGSRQAMLESLFLGNVNGCIGEVSALLIILGGVFLIYKRYIFWQGPVFYLTTVALLGWVFGHKGLFTGDPLFQLLSGGLVLGAFYMLTDMVTSPITRRGQIVFAVGGGLLVFLIRRYAGYPEGVCYSILLMNCATPMIDRIFVAQPPRSDLSQTEGGQA